MNFVASSDWVVAFFPKVFEVLGLRGLGSAGHDGFEITSNIRNFEFVKGGHGAALEEEVWDAIADFVIKGEVNLQLLKEQLREKRALAEHRAGWVVIPGLFPPLVWVVIVGIAWWIWQQVSGAIDSGITGKETAAFVEGIALSAYLLLLWLVLTRV